jgi:rod shape-determining protein MreB
MVEDVEMASEILRQLFCKFYQGGKRGAAIARALACAPSGTTETERLAIEQAIRGAGVGEVFIVPEPLAAAIGAGLDVSKEQASMVIDFGEGITDCAIIADGQVKAALAVRGGCCRIRESVANAIQGEIGCHVSDSEAERLVRHVGLLGSGRIASRLMVTVRTQREDERFAIPSCVVAEVIASSLDAIFEPISAFTSTLDERRLIDVFEQGVLLTGGGALIPGMEERFAGALRLPIVVAAAPLQSVIDGAREMLGVVNAAGLWGGS